MVSTSPEEKVWIVCTVSLDCGCLKRMCMEPYQMKVFRNEMDARTYCQVLEEETATYDKSYVYLYERELQGIAGRDIKSASKIE